MMSANPRGVLAGAKLAAVRKSRERRKGVTYIVLQKLSEEEIENDDHDEAGDEALGAGPSHAAGAEPLVNPL